MNVCTPSVYIQCMHWYIPNGAKITLIRVLSQVAICDGKWFFHFKTIVNQLVAHTVFSLGKITLKNTLSPPTCFDPNGSSSGSWSACI